MFQIADSCVILITRESWNSLIWMVRWRPRNQKSDPLPSCLWLNHTNICSTGRDSVIQKFFFFWTDPPPSNRFDTLWSCRFYLGYHQLYEIALRNKRKLQYVGETCQNLNKRFNWHSFCFRNATRNFSCEILRVYFRKNKENHWL